MDNVREYVLDSLELHLFFARIMKEHALFLKVGFQPPAAELAREGERYLRAFEDLLSRTVALSDRVVRRQVLESGEVVTCFTDTAEQQTQRLTGTRIDRSITARELRLSGTECGAKNISPALVSRGRRLNRDALRLVNGLIDYKQRLLEGANSCRLFTANYPLLIEHILREARLYRAKLLRLEGLPNDDRDHLRDNERFWDRIMMEHALFIRGLLDPTEEDLIRTADDFAVDYRRLLDAAKGANDQVLQGAPTQALTKKFRDFKCAAVEGIEECQIRSIILPLLADHVLREANRYLRILKD